MSRDAAAPLLQALADAGLPTEGFGQFHRGSKAGLCAAPDFDYERSVPILLEWLPRIEDPRVKEAIVRSLSTKYAKPAAAPALIREFKRAVGDPLGLRWVIGNALEVVADRSVFDELVELAKDKSYGRSREMIVLALARTRHPAAPDVVIELLDDDEVAGHAVAALRRLAPAKARSRIEPFIEDRRPWVRREAAAALARIDRSEGTG